MTSAPTPAEIRGPAARVGLWLGPLAFAAVVAAPLPDLAFEGRTVVATTSCRVVMGLAAWMAAWWMTEALPLAATSLLPLVVLPVAGALGAKEVARAYFDDTLALFLGGFCLAFALEKSGLHRRLAIGVVRLFGTRPRRLVLGFFVASAAVSMWVSNTATTLMLMPVATTVIAAVLPGPAAGRSRDERNFAACCVLAVAYGACLGGMGTLVGTPPNMILKRNLEELVRPPGSAPITFAGWMAIGVPIVAVFVPVAWALLTRLALPVPARFREPVDVRARFPDLGRVRFSERAVFAVFLATALCWVTHAPIEIGSGVLPLTGWDSAFRHGGRDSFVTDATIAIAATLVLFVLPSRDVPGDRLLTWEFVRTRLPWGGLLLFGGGFALAESFRASGLDGYLKAVFGGLQGMPPVLLTLVVVAGVTAVSEVASNTATAAMLLPVLASVGAAAGMDPLPLLLAGTLGASCGFALPVATMANTIAYGTGEVTPAQMGRAGLILDLAGILLVTAAVTALAPLMFG